VYAAVKNISWRKQNVIVTELPERDDITDREAFLELCLPHLPVKPFVDENDSIVSAKATHGDF